MPALSVTYLFSKVITNSSDNLFSFFQVVTSSTHRSKASRSAFPSYTFGASTFTRFSIFSSSFRFFLCLFLCADLFFFFLGCPSLSPDELEDDKDEDEELYEDEGMEVVDDEDVDDEDEEFALDEDEDKVTDDSEDTETDLLLE